MNKLNKRLQTIANMIKPCSHLIDVGCDHGYLSIALVLNQKCRHVLNIDVNQEPLNFAKQNIIHYQLNQQIDCLLNNGLQNLNLDFQPDYITIAGMGGILMTNILATASIESKKYILQPNNNILKLRKWLFEHKYQIIDEQVVFDNQIGYLVFEIIKSTIPIVYDNFDLYLGPILKNKHQPDVMKYYQEKLDQLSKIPEQFLDFQKQTQIKIIKEFLNV